MNKGKIVIQDNILDTLFAVTEEEQSSGLQYKEWPPPIMTFVYSEPRINKFWMHKTPSPLDIIFCYKGKVSAIYKGEPLSTKIIGNDELSDLVIEMPFETIKLLNIKIGDIVKIIA